MDVLSELLAGGRWEVIAHTPEVIGRDLVFSHIPQSLGHEYAGATGKREHAARISPEIDL